MVRVLHVSPYFPPAMQYGGPPASVLGLCQGLQRAGVDVEVVTTTANGESPLAASPAEGGRYDGVPVRYVKAAFPRRFFGARVRGPLLAALARADTVSSSSFPQARSSSCISVACIGSNGSICWLMRSTNYGGRTHRRTWCWQATTSTG